MNEEQRIKAVLRGEKPDKLPWVARIVLWYNYHKDLGTLPDRYRDWDMWDIQRDLGMGILARLYMYETYTENVEEVVTRRGDHILTEYRTPVGSMQTVHVDAPEQAHASATKYQVEKPVKGDADYDVACYMVDHTFVRPKYEEFYETERKLRGDGFALPLIIRSPWQRILIEYAGYEQSFFDLQDRPAKVEALYQSLYAFAKDKLWPILFDSPAEYIQSNDNFSALVTNPAMFERFCYPYFKEFGDALHARGKQLGTHIDGEPKALMPLLSKAQIDVAEAFTPTPMTSITTAEARQLAGPSLFIWGGIPSAVLTPDSMGDEAFDEYMVDLFAQVKGDERFILGVGDNVMPEVNIERVRRVRDLVEKYA